MFNAMCFSRAQKIRTLNKGFYCYTIRPSGAFMKKRDAELVGNKMALLEARSNIVKEALIFLLKTMQDQMLCPALN